MFRSVQRVSPRTAIAIAFLLRGIIQGSWYPHIPDVTARVDISSAQLGTVFFLFALGNIIAFSAAAKLIARVGSARAQMAFAVPFSLIVIVLGMSSSVLQFGVFMFVYGVLTGGFDISTSVQGAVTERQTGKPMMSALYGLFSVGALTGSFVSGQIAQADISMSLQFTILAAIAVPLIIIISRGMLPDDIVPAPSMRSRRFLPTLPPKVLLPLGLCIVCIALGEETINNWIALYLRENLSANAAIASLAFTFFSIATAIGRLFGDSVIARVGVDRTLQIGSIAAATGVAFGMIVNQPWAVIVGYTVMGLGLSVVVPVTYRRANQIPGISPATAVATVASIGFVGFLVGPLIIGAIADLTSLRISISIVSVMLLGIWLLTRLNPSPTVLVDSPATDSITGNERGAI